MARPTGPAALDRPRRRVLLVAMPWGLAAVLAVLGVMGRSSSPPPGSIETIRPAPASTPSPSPSPAATTPTRSLTLEPDIRLEVLAAARTALGTAGLADAVGGDPARWPLELTVVDITRVTGGLAVATVHGVVIEREDEIWTAPTIHAAAVPLTLTPAPAVGGRAWPLHPPTPTAVTVDGPPVDDPDPGLVDALTEHDWQVEGVAAVTDLGEGVLRIELDGRPPGGRDVARHSVWLVDDGSGPQPLPRPGQP